MAERAHVTSIDALESFRASLLVYQSKARPLLEDTYDAASRMRQWVQSDRRMYWEHQVRRRAKELEQAQEALFRAGLSNLRQPTTAEQAAVQRAKRALEEAETKLRLVKRWSQEFDHRVEPLVKQLDFLRTVLANGIPKAAAYLAQTIKTLQAYAEVKPVGAAGPPPSAPTDSGVETPHEVIPSSNQQNTAPDNMTESSSSDPAAS